MVIYRNDPEGTTHFLNVDLDVYSSSDLQPLVAALGKKVFVLHVGRHKRTWSAHMELTRVTRNADSTVRAFCAVIESLPRTALALWNSAKVRDFNVGVQAGPRPLSCEFPLSSETVNAVSGLGARIVFTIYAAQENPKGSAG